MWLQARGLSNDVLFIFIGNIEGGKQVKITFLKKPSIANVERGKPWVALARPPPRLRRDRDACHFSPRGLP